MQEEIMKILKMVEEGKISSEKASELIEALNSKRLPETPLFNQHVNEDRVLRIKVITAEKGETVNLQFPIKFVSGMLKMFGKIPMDVHDVGDVDMKIIQDAIESGTVGKIVEIKSSKGDIVEISIE
ncbi:SHOCT-like domain-containing protein [Clostridium oryzae]|uniref:YvlB/LiaX N-terminal domain-containing protein n=1 Tax=Clostridium oryzae TaxID=1450648 RepID=A0A1V4IS02_9CLOT|nr:hypothetical protein [Clostridium oryzae]OPJ62227.1 hypothetical protein CLORY_18350 [Clostridium oryzae]